MPRKPRTQPQNRKPTELHHDSETLHYEFDMLVHLARGFSALDNKDRLSRNAYLESFAVHCRALIFFLFGHDPLMTANGQLENFSGVQDSDVMAFDFHPGWPANCPQPAPVILDSKRQADKHVAHMTTDRRTRNQPGSLTTSEWDLEAVTSAICSVFDCFLRTAPAANFDPTKLREMEALVSEWTSPPVLGVARCPVTTTMAMETEVRMSLRGKTQPG
jgi:hypothetical protein